MLITKREEDKGNGGYQSWIRCFRNVPYLIPAGQVAGSLLSMANHLLSDNIFARFPFTCAHSPFTCARFYRLVSRQY